jgi:integral membrane protein
VALNITIIHITVIVGGIVLGPRAGFLFGFTWGVCSLILAYTSANILSFMIFTNPLISILPRLLMGGLVALFYHKTTKLIASDRLRMAVSGFLGSIMNTVFVLSSIYLLMGNQYAELKGKTVAELPLFLMSVVMTNGVPEALAATVVTPIIASILVKIYKKRG